jgi:GntR family transcriptional regulator / MocR family aminotransferase
MASRRAFLLTSFHPEPLLKLDRGATESLSRQIQTQLRDAIRRGLLKVGARLPSTRSLSGDLGVSRPVVLDAYDQLAAEGYLHTRQGARPVVADVAGAVDTARVERRENLPIRHDLRPAIPDLSMFPRKTWLKALRRTIDQMPAAAFGYDGRHGTLELRRVLADYLGRVRGVIADADRIVITSGFAEARALVSLVLRSSGVRRLGVEDPSYSTWQSVDQAGLRRVPVAVDDEGLLVDQLDALDVQAVFVTPAHQFPTGAVLGKERRRKLADWLSANDTFAFEDDYDAEFRYDHQPVGALQGLSPERVIYAGTVSKTLAPGLRLGWLVIPGELVGAVKAEQLRWNEGSPRIDQNALATFIETGDYDRHLRSMRRIYRARRDVLMRAIREFLPMAAPAGIAAGLHVPLQLPSHIDEAKVCEAAGRRGVAVEGIRKYRLSGEGAPVLLLGYGSASESSLRAAVRIIAEAIG